MSNNFVLDNSVVMAWCFEDESSQYSDIILGNLEFSTGFVPAIWPLEVTNVLLVAEGKGKSVRQEFPVLLHYLINCQLSWNRSLLQGCLKKFLPLAGSIICPAMMLLIWILQ